MVLEAAPCINQKFTIYLRAGQPPIKMKANWFASTSGWLERLFGAVNAWEKLFGNAIDKAGHSGACGAPRYRPIGSGPGILGGRSMAEDRRGDW
jgi:hypothetical protein